MNRAGPDPKRIWQLVHGAVAWWLAVAAVELAVFDLLAPGPLTAARLAEAVGADGAKLAVLLDGLVATGLLEVTDAGYANTSDGSLLVRGAAGSMADLLVHSPGRPANWARLADTVRTGRPPSPVDDDGDFYGLLAGATLPVQYQVARSVAGALADRGATVERVLDVGAGAAPWAVAVLEAFPAATAVVNDLPAVVPAASGQLAGHGLADRAQLVPGDYRTLSPPPAAFDLVVLGHVCRAEGEAGAAELIERAAGWVRPAGLLAVSDYFVDDRRQGSENARLLGVTMMANTLRGAAFTYGQFRGWLARAGCPDPELFVALPGQEVMLARKEPT